MVDTIFRFKGLERQVIVLTEIDTLDLREHMAAFYVGLTRARLHLIVVGGKHAVGRLQAYAKNRQPMGVR